MHLVRLLPITRSAVVHELSYYSALAYPVGSILRIPVRTREVFGVVTHVEEVAFNKASLRTSSYALRKLPRQTVQAVLLPEFVRAALSTADQQAVLASAVLNAYIPKVLLECEDLPIDLQHGLRPRLRGFIVPRLYQGLFEHRIEFYRTSIREAFAAHGSVVLICPTIVDAERVYEELHGGIERYAFMLHSTLSQKKQQKTVQELLACEHPVLLICTPGYLSVPRHDLTTVIVERESSSLYRRSERPRVDVRLLAHEFAAALGGQLYLADLPLRIDSVYRKETGEYEEIATGHHRMHFHTRAEIIDMKGEAREPKKPFTTIGRDLLTRMHRTIENNGRVFLYVARRGLSPFTLCGDCGTAVTCRECDASVVLHKGKEEDYFLCHACGSMRHARERCVRCQSWRLETLGVGTEGVYQEVLARLPQAHTILLSSDTVRTHRQTCDRVREFYSTQRSVLVGTELALPYLQRHIPLIGVVSLDSLLSLASWNVYERITGTLTRLRELAGEELLIQTRHPEETIFSHALAGNYSGFYRSELKMRKQYGYPPYTVLLKVSVTGTETEVQERIAFAREHLVPYELITYSRVLKAPHGKLMVHGFLRVPRESWPDPVLIERLRALSPLYDISINPDSIL